MLTMIELATLLAQAAAPEQVTMTAAGWTIMGVSLASVLMLNVFCFYRILSLPSAAESHLKAPLEIDTGDLSDPD